MKVTTCCVKCGFDYVYFKPAPRSYRFIRAACFRCGYTAIAGVDEQDALAQWAVCNDPKTAFRKKRRV